MARYRFELATQADDAELRTVLASTPMPGRISVTLRCEPSFFDAARVLGNQQQVIACRDVESGQIVGFGCRSIQSRYVNGRSRPIGYLNSLRLLEPHRRRGLVARGYRLFADLHKHDRSTELYLTTIAQGNDVATKTLTSERAGLPRYRPAGTYHTLVVPVRGRTYSSSSDTASIRPATANDLPEVLGFLEREGPKRQFFPAYSANDFFHASATFRDLEPGELMLAFDNGQLVGTMASWNQSRFRQFVVNDYAAAIRWLRPLANSWFGLQGMPKLPRRGEAFRYAMAAIPVVANDSAPVFEALLDATLQRLRQTETDYLLVGMHECDPLLTMAMRRKATEYLTNLYLVSWPDENGSIVPDDRPPYLELGSL
ncbi:MAG: hypothetical protein KDB27_14495 [Planctomycetales bacterium]|nr:hypothetical protein [Planctomycetales bacterium]